MVTALDMVRVIAIERVLLVVMDISINRNGNGCSVVLGLVLDSCYC